MLSTGVNYFERAIEGKITLDKKLIMRYLEGCLYLLEFINV
jgi:hypothetical protein